MHFSLSLYLLLNLDLRPELLRWRWYEMPGASDNIDISASLIDGAQIAHTDLQTRGEERGPAIDHLDWSEPSQRSGRESFIRQEVYVIIGANLVFLITHFLALSFLIEAQVSATSPATAWHIPHLGKYT